MEQLPADRPEVMHVELSDLRAALRAGWRDFLAAPQYGLLFAGIYVIGGWLIYFALTGTGQLWWTLAAAAGFPILGPFIACGLYDVSRRLEAGLPMDRHATLLVIFRQKDRQIPSMAAVIVVFFLFWNFLSHMIFALFLGTAVMTNVSSSLAVFATPAGLTMLAVGTSVGAVFSTLLFSLTVVSLPMLLEREVDFVTAMLTSFAVVMESPLVMLGWGAFIAVALFVAMLPGFLGLFVVLPVLGHASWHLYRSAVSWNV
ncbi:DUF2189 domain-containing protein [Cypionkella sp.]|uniref:DUF2189 domain-containing protein n=1 Tax=Cypionkella sp. TaxID=2811411 RepID=UPI002715AB6F|nr:DUF2189 domain-containing protein [Cypionkella sp.]MDO8983137.1 DUF2189 domain-containing protein [Cypionkella sp.]MDP1577499.1 DUF2189 domain-containing protein [Cypionkella sp.]MDP2049807.1 DUF2189 domain-containing protein [Cypionkella sp.]